MHYGQLGDIYDVIKWVPTSANKGNVGRHFVLIRQKSMIHSSNVGLRHNHTTKASESLLVLQYGDLRRIVLIKTDAQHDSFPEETPTMTKFLMI